ncbi:MAG: histidine phosphatase family protein [Spirochaetaceae bacterium]|nr:histidine phosphatase family protein [Spirochaetaceae bacterium]
MESGPTHLLLVRHGETPWNAAGRWQGHGDPGLSERGRAQARELARILVAERDAGDDWQGVVASDLARARETAEVVARALDVGLELDARLRELDVGRWSGLTREEILARDPETLAAFERGLPDVRPGGGECRVEIRERAQAFVGDLARRRAGERLVVVTHLGVIRALVPGSRPANTERIAVVAETIASRPIDRSQRPGEGPL